MNERELYKIIRLLLMKVLFDKEVKIPDGFSEWKELYEELTVQTVQFLPIDFISNFNIDLNLKKKWKSQAVNQVYLFEKYLYEQDKVLKILEENQIICAVIKGCSCASYYPHPEYRRMGDIDIIVKSGQYEAVCDCMKENGYIEQSKREHHVTFCKNGIDIEIHKKTTHEHTKMIKKIEEWELTIQEGFEKLEQDTIFGYAFPVFPKLQQGMVLLNHMASHLDEGLGMRQIVDWMLYVNQSLDDEFWREQFQPVAKKFEIEKFAVAITRMCQVYLGLPEENTRWCLNENLEDEIYEDLLNTVILQGNMGRKMNEKNAVENTLSNRENFWQLVKAMNRNGAKRWKMVERYPFLKHVGWLYQSCHYLKQWKKEKISIKTLKEKKKRRLHLENLYK